MDHQTFPIVHGNTHIPFLPVDFVAFDRKRDSLRLLDNDRLDILAEILFADELGQEIVLLQRNDRTSELAVSRLDALDINDFHLTQIYKQQSIIFALINLDVCITYQ